MLALVCYERNSTPNWNTSRCPRDRRDLLYYRARYYDQSVGRFASEDPSDFGAGTNFYNYAANDPTVFIDPLGLWHCAANVNCNFTPGLKKALDCFDKCTNSNTLVTGGVGKRSKPNSSHSKGEACDVGRNGNPKLPRDTAERCFLQCFPNGYGQEENNDPANPGTHFHFQENTAPGALPRFAPGIQPYAP